MRGYVFVLVLGLAAVLHGAEVASNTEGSESKNIEFKDGSYSSMSNFEKIKRGAVKLSNADAPSFNHLTSTSSSSSNSASSSGSSGASGNAYKSLLSSSVPPFRYIQSGHYQPLAETYLQPSQSAAQFASQYTFQSTPLTHYLQMPAHVQYVSHPTVAHLPYVKFQNLGGNYFSSNSVADTSASSVAHQSAQSAASTTQARGSSAAAAANSQTKGFASYQNSQPLYYQQPFVMFFLQPQTAASNFLYQQPGFNYYLKQQPQQYLNFQTGHRFGLYPMTHANQFTYLVPMTVATTPTQSGATGNELKTSTTKLLSGSQSSSGSSFTYGNKG